MDQSLSAKGVLKGGGKGGFQAADHLLPCTVKAFRIVQAWPLAFSRLQSQSLT